MSLISQLNTIQDVVDISVNSLLDFSINTTNTIQINKKQVNDISYNVYKILNDIYCNVNNLIYSSNYRGLQESSDQLYFEDEIISGAIITTYEKTGLQISTPPGFVAYQRKTRFFIPQTGKSLVVFNLSSSFIDVLAHIYFFQFGLIDINNSIMIRIQYIVWHNSGAFILQIFIRAYNNTDSLGTPNTIANTLFNIDTVNGSGISNFNFEQRWHNQTFFILSDDNLSFIFGLSDGKKLIPIHSFNLADTYELFPNGGRVPIFQPYYYLGRFDGNIGTLNVTMSGMRIYKESELKYNIQHTVDSSLNSIASLTETPLIAIRYLDTSEYRGNIQLNKLNINCNKICRIKIYYGRGTDLTLTTPTWNSKENIQYDLSSNTFSGGTKIYSTLTNTEVNVIDLLKVVDFKYFGYDYSLSNSNIILFTITNLEISNADSNFSLSWYNF